MLRASILLTRYCSVNGFTDSEKVEKLGRQVTDLQGRWWFWAGRGMAYAFGLALRMKRDFWVEVVAHIGCTGIQGLAHTRK